MTLKPANLIWDTNNTPASRDYGDLYFQRGQGFAETDFVFIEGNDLKDRFSKVQDSFTVAELGFGCGVNFMRTAQAWREKARPGARLDYISIEKHPIPLAQIKDAHTRLNMKDPSISALQAQYPPMVRGLHAVLMPENGLYLWLYFDDAQAALKDLNAQVDAWFLDGFAPRLNPDMWSRPVLENIARLSKPKASLATFSSARAVQDRLTEVGFSVDKTKGFGAKKYMLKAHFKKEHESFPPASLKSVAVIGAGIAGCSSAWALALAGMNVTLYDRHKDICGGASGNFQAVVYPRLTADFSPMGLFHRTAFSFTRAQLIALMNWHGCGVLHLDLDQDRKKRHEKIAQLYQAPDFVTKTKEGLWMPQAGFIAPRNYCTRLIDHPNITFKPGIEVEELTTKDHDVSVITTSYEVEKFLKNKSLPIDTVRGQMSLLPATTSSAGLPHVICHQGYVTPAVNNLHAIGATFQREPVSPPTLRPLDQQENINTLRQYVPDYHFADPIDGRCHYRAATPDRLPLIGALDEKTYCAVAFGSHGFSTAPLAGALLAAMITHKPWPLPPSLLKSLAPQRYLNQKKS